MVREKAIISPMPPFEERANTLVATAEKIARIKEEKEEADILKGSKASLVKTGYDNWDGGIDIYSLILEVPIHLFAKIDEQQKTVEQSILEKINQLIRVETAYRITEVIISPILIDNTAVSIDPENKEELLRTSMTRSIKSIKTKYKLWKLKCLSILKQITNTKQRLPQSYLLQEGQRVYLKIVLT